MTLSQDGSRAGLGKRALNLAVGLSLSGPFEVWLNPRGDFVLQDVEYEMGVVLRRSKPFVVARFCCGCLCRCHT